MLSPQLPQSTVLSLLQHSVRLLQSALRLMRQMQRDVRQRRVQLLQKLPVARMQKRLLQQQPPCQLMWQRY